MDNFESALKNKIDKVIIAYKKVKKDNEILAKENEELKSALIEKEEEVKELINKYNRLQFAKGMEESGQEKEYAFKQINSIVREINKCIALLNT